MATMRHDRTSLWGDPRISATEILEGLLEEERRATMAPRAAATPFVFAGASFVAALGLKLFGLDRAARLFAWFVAPMLVLGVYDRMTRRSAKTSEAIAAPKASAS